ncbi:MAG TPA: precorrin-3B synthase [Pseudonocardiaceae bacterium]
MPAEPPVNGVAAQRVRADSCPGALALHTAEDGLLARVRLPGGRVSAAALRALAAIAEDLGDGRLELTSRANVQVRGLVAKAGAELVSRLSTAGLLPAPRHERVRNIILSPLSGVDGGGRADLSDLADELDQALCARPRLAELPGRFLFAIDDGRGDLLGIDADIRVTALDRHRVHLWPGDVVLPRARAVAAVMALSEAFLDERAAQTRDNACAAWRVRELSGGAAVVAKRAFAGQTLPSVGLPRTDPALSPIGRVGVRALVVLPPLGRLDSGQARTVADHCDPAGARVTPWRSVVLLKLTDLESTERAMRRAGLVTSGTSPWFGVSSCAGRPGCAKALRDVQADARAWAANAVSGGPTVHWSGCARRCGRPSGTVVDVLATETGYAVSDAGGDFRSVAEQDLGTVIEAIRHV